MPLSILILSTVGRFVRVAAEKLPFRRIDNRTRRFEKKRLASGIKRGFVSYLKFASRQFYI